MTTSTSRSAAAGDKPILHFSHANGFPAGTYRLFFEQLGQRYDVRALAMHAHNPRYPVDDGWRALAQELVDELLARYDAPVILAGHSLGGVLSLMAAAARPDLVRCVVLLDSPIVTGWRALFLRLAKLLKLDSQPQVAKASARRRWQWPDAEATYQHYAVKDVFAGWAPHVLRDYVESAVVPDDSQNGVRLRFLRETETAIYQTVPHHLAHLTRQPFPVPIGFIGGVDSVESRLAGLDGIRRLVGSHLTMLPGGHLFPMESPVAAAQATLAMLDDLLTTA